MKLIVGLLLASIPMLSVVAEESIIRRKENFHLFLLVGQSNMAGRGKIEEQDKVVHPRVLMLSKENQWIAAVDPMHFDKPSAGVGLGRTFGAIIADSDENISVGLIPCAVGGSPIDSWTKGVFYEPTKSYPWDDAIARTKIALQTGALKGILWHQGESDSTPELADGYEKKLRDLIARFRLELNTPDVPFIVGQLGRFDKALWSNSRNKVNAAHQALPAIVPYTAFVSSEGLTDNGDQIHFDSKSLRDFGKRYATSFFDLTHRRKD